MCVRSSARVGAAAAVTERAGLERAACCRLFFQGAGSGFDYRALGWPAALALARRSGAASRFIGCVSPLPWRAATPRDNAGSSPPAGVCGVHLGEEWVAFGEGGGVRGAA